MCVCVREREREETCVLEKVSILYFTTTRLTYKRIFYLTITKGNKKFYNMGINKEKRLLPPLFLWEELNVCSESSPINMLLVLER